MTSCSQNCDHLIPLTTALTSLHKRVGDFNLDHAFTVARIGICLTCKSDLRGHPPTRTEALEAVRELHAILLPPIDEEFLYSMPFKLPWVKSAAKKMICPHCAKEYDVPAQAGSIYPQIVYDPEGNPINVVIHVGHSGRGLNSSKAAIGLLVHKLLEWGCPPEEIARTLIGHASATGHARWRMGETFIFSMEDGIGKVLGWAMVGRVVGEFLRQYGSRDDTEIQKEVSHGKGN